MEIEIDSMKSATRLIVLDKDICEKEIEEESIKLICESNLYELKDDPTKWSNSSIIRVVMASLVKGVYKLEEERTSKQNYDQHTLWWETFGYKLESMIHENIEEQSGTILAGIFQHQLDEGPPKSVVAMRGTILTRPGDIEADIYILQNHLPAHPRFHTMLGVVKAEVEQHGARRVSLTGHSKGAALGLLIGRRLAEKGIHVDCHLFNPPNPSVPLTILPPRPSEPILNALDEVQNVVHNAAAKALTVLLVDEDERHRASESFRRISTWFPTLYVNPEDPISAAYITYFMAEKLVPSLKKHSHVLDFFLSNTPRSIRSICRTFVGLSDFRVDHLIPSAELVLDTEIPELELEPGVVESLYRAHALSQWLNLGLQLTSTRLTFNEFDK